MCEIQVEKQSYITHSDWPLWDKDSWWHIALRGLGNEFS